jgi:hypothetical protein
MTTPTQTSPASQARPQPPQFWELVVKLTHKPLHRVSPVAGHGLFAAQVPAMQE